MLRDSPTVKSIRNSKFYLELQQAMNCFKRGVKMSGTSESGNIHTQCSLQCRNESSQTSKTTYNSYHKKINEMRI